MSHFSKVRFSSSSLLCTAVHSYEMVLTKSFALVWRWLRCTWSHRDWSAGTEKAFNASQWRRSSNQTEGWTHVWSAPLQNSHKKANTWSTVCDSTCSEVTSCNFTCSSVAARPTQKLWKDPLVSVYRAELKRHFRSAGLVSLPVVSGEVLVGTEIPGGGRGGDYT